MPIPSNPRYRALQVVETVLAIAVLASTWDAIDDVFGTFPTWLYFGDVTIPTLVIAPAILAIAIGGELLLARRERVSPSPSQLGLFVLAGLTILTVVYAVADLNLADSGVFWAGFFPLVTGVLLAAGVLLARAVDVTRGHRIAAR